MFMGSAAKLILPLLASALLGYLLGSINWSIILTRQFKNKEDIRKYGSGNAGMTNVLRSVGKLPAALTFVGDFLKCVAAVLLARLMLYYGCQWAGAPLAWIEIGQYIAGFCCVLGHIFPIYYGFRGGKGVVTSAAMIAILDWRVFLLVLLVFVIFFLWKKIVSLASISAAVAYPILTFLVTFFFDCKESPLLRDTGTGYSLAYVGVLTLFSLCIGATVVIKHRANIGRLLRGEEKPVSLKKKK